MRMQFPMTPDGRALCVVSLEASLVERVNGIIEDLSHAAIQLQLRDGEGQPLPVAHNSCADPLSKVESLVAQLPDGTCLAYQRNLWNKDQFAVYQEGRKVEVVYRHSGNGTVTYISLLDSDLTQR